MESSTPNRVALIVLSLTAACRPQPEERRPAVDVALADSTTADVVVDAHDDEPVETRDARRLQGPFGIVLVPAGDARAEAPLVLYLHGMWASPEDSCSYFERAAVGSVLACPRGNAPAEAGGAWRGSFAEKRRAIDLALDEAKIPMTATGNVAMGFSSGAALALELATQTPGRFTGLVLMSMVLHPDPERLKAAKVRRVALATGDLDGSRGALLDAEKRLNAGGVEARFYSLGKVGHHFAVDMDAKMVEVLAWVRGT